MPQKFQAGGMRERIAIEQHDGSLEADGSESATGWATFDTVWASVVPIRPGREIYTANQVQGQLAYRFQVRYRSDVIPKMRILFDGRYFDILSAADIDGRRRFTEIVALERV